ncbi:spermidine/putrescine transport system permease protein [Roseimicrobium gellanilyticum]|uniref:Spermidine/putrescine transport system permease protein n=1 Tax=Roseimicrobium gellanilyticum TaxID=748857 RepID=A0A366HD52_9BACT|nr:ABC transporter permease [Roseimicrobium gellanilyticum]RBP40307.1 spermidine/putrescine transport system permease protein [Roseimicrobium gellanilyticum]
MSGTSRSRTGEVLLTLPSFGWMLVCFFIPALIVLYLSFKPADSMGGVGEGWTLAHWSALVEEQYRPILWRTLWLSTATSCICVLLAVPCSLVLARLQGAWRHVLLLLVVIPFWTNFLIRIFAWKSLLHPEGFLSSTLRSAGLLSEDAQLLYNSGSVLLVMVYTQLPFAILPLYAAAEKFDFSLLEAARDLGASARRAIWSVFVPGVSRGIATAFLSTFVCTLGMYVVPDIVGGTDTEMLGNRIAQRVRTDRNLPLAAALSGAMLGMVALMFLAQALVKRLLTAPEGGSPYVLSVSSSGAAGNEK